MNKILVVDDDRRINELLDDIFTMEGFEVYSISNVTDSGVVIEQVVEGGLSANTPYIIKATEAGDKTIKVTGATLSVPVAYEETIGNFIINGT